LRNVCPKLNQFDPRNPNPPNNRFNRGNRANHRGNPPKPPVKAKVFALGRNELGAAVVEGTLAIQNYGLNVLTDSGSTHSYINQD
jgi:hypothetical protein